MSLALEILHCGPAAHGEQQFAVGEIRSRLVPVEGESGSYVREVWREILSDGITAPPPAKWPIPNDAKSDLARALPWYLEDYVQKPTKGGDLRASFVRKALMDWGGEVFHSLFHDDQTLSAYDERTGIPFDHESTLEIISTDAGVLSWPWEAMIDNNSVFVGRQVAIDRRLFSQLPERAERKRKEGPLRVLLLSAREDENDVDYLLIGRILASRPGVALTALRPASLTNLARAIAEASEPFDVVHFDCHGLWSGPSHETGQCNLMLEIEEGGCAPTTADELLRILAKVPPQHVVLNACRSGMISSASDELFPSIAAMLLSLPEIDDVVAMSYNLPVAAARNFLGGFYYGLEIVDPIAVAVEHGRYHLKNDFGADDDLTDVGSNSWIIPVSYRRFNPGEYHQHVIGSGRHWPRADDRTHCVGLDSIFWMLDHLEPRIRYVSLYGLMGSGKSTLLDEFFWWRRQSGDPRPSISIDLDQADSARDVLASMATQIGVEVSADMDSTQLSQMLAKRVTECPHWIAWDSFNRARLPKSERKVLGHLIDAIGSSSSVLIVAGFGLSEWIDQSANSLGLDVRARDSAWIQLAKQEWRNAVADPKTSFPATDPDLADLLFYIAGNGLTIRCAMFAMANGATAKQVLDDFRKGSQEALGSALSEPSIAAFWNTLVQVRDDSAVADLLPLFSLHDEIVDPSLLITMMKRLGASQESIVKSFLALVRAGAINPRGHLHPILNGQIRKNVCANHATRMAFAEVVYDAVTPTAGEQSANEKPHLTVGSLEQAARILADADRMEAAVTLVQYGAITLYQKGRNDRANALFREFIEAAPNSHDRRLALFAAIEHSMHTSDARNAQQLLSDPCLTDEDLPGDAAVQVLFERGRIARLNGDRKTARSLMQSAISSADDEISPALRALMEAEMAATIDPEDLASRDSTAAGQYGYPTGSPGDLRMHAQQLMAKGDLDGALRQIDRAISLDKARAQHHAGAMNISLKGDILGHMNRIEEARTCFEDAITTFESIGATQDAAVSHHQWGAAAYRNDLLEEAAHQFILAAKQFRDLGADHILQQITHNFDRLVSTPGLEQLGGIFALQWAAAGLPETAAISRGKQLLVDMLGGKDDRSG